METIVINRGSRLAVEVIAKDQSGSVIDLHDEEYVVAAEAIGPQQQRVDLAPTIEEGTGRVLIDHDTVGMEIGTWYFDLRLTGPQEPVNDEYSQKYRVVIEEPVTQPTER